MTEITANVPKVNSENFTLTPETAAAMLTRGGFSIVPLKIDGSKAAIEEWKKFQTRKPTPEEIEGWYGNGKTRGVAAIQGKISGNSETVDFDDPELWDPFCETLEELNPGLLARLLQVQTPRPGYQITYRCRVIGRNRALALGERPARPDDKPESVYENDQGEFVVKYSTIETRGEGGYIVCVGSPPRVHKNKKPYVFLNRDYEHVVEITPEERDIIFAICKGLSELPIPPESASEDRERMRRARKPGELLPGDDYNERGDNRALLQKHGWTYKKTDRDGELWTRPGKDPKDGQSARLFENGNLYIFSSNAHPFVEERCYSPFAQYAVLECKDDFKKAAKDLARQGYGWEDEPENSELSEEEAAAVEEVLSSTREENDQNPEPLSVVAHRKILDLILAKVEPLDFAKKFVLMDMDMAAAKPRHYIVLSIDELLETVKRQHYRLARKNDFVFAYNGEYWKELDRDDLKDFLARVAQKHGTRPLDAKYHRYRDELYKQFLAAASFQTPEPDEGKVLINLRNGTFEITADSQEKRKFRAEDFLKYQLPFDYDEEATAPKFKAYLDRVLPEKELQDICAEFFGYVFTRNLKFEKALLLYGCGANGKSVIFDVMVALFGPANITNYSLSDLLEEHNRAQIAHKLLNYGSEINASVTRDIFKILVSGEPIMARLKYGNSFLMNCYAKLCFNANELPKDIDQNEAYFRRLQIIPFRVTIPEAEQDKELAQKIIRDELSGVFNWVLAGLKRLLEQKRFTDSPIAREVLATYKRESDSVACFLRDEHWAQDPHEPEHTEKLKKLYMCYTSYCREAGSKPLGRNNFAKRLEANGIVRKADTEHAQEFYISYQGGQA